MTAEPVYVIEKNITNALKVNQKCPSCNNYKAFKKVSTTQGEHAGVKHERSVEHYICTKCSYKWTKS